MKKHDVVVIGGGAAGLMCAIEAGKRGRDVLVVDHAKKPCEKIRISGGGRCNFTNVHTSFKQFLSENPRFAISPLKRYSQHDFISRVKKQGIAFHEKTLGQLFCDESSQQIIDMLLDDMRAAGGRLRMRAEVSHIAKMDNQFHLTIDGEHMRADQVVIATGGKSIPKMGATGFGYEVAKHFGLDLVETRPALVPLTFDQSMLETMKELSGISVDDAVVKHGKKTKFSEAMLFTHRGLSGPSILQISSFWREGDEIEIAMLPEMDVFSSLKQARQENGKQEIQTCLAQWLPKKLVAFVLAQSGVQGRLADLGDKKLTLVADQINAWRIKPTGSEGYRTAEVTLGGVSTDELDNKTMEAKKVPGLYFVGEVVDMTGWLGGYNFQWAWSSGWVAGNSV
ncbi:NAD(P)/FAD-dependent oxidoreductase [Maritalea porphyrae]|jgi:predicted Rossmann fold flavoprotein|uniref:NAD(P)/FAD-dependent oxidoreductase n=1 Tax=Maritalea porphyrae TaxID=880732 RepID=UPI0022AF5B34|nr:NAD(P)/FAD-dependent oxidoreductase [Maritalea porphyrae]MCZ4272375.1 NAD(P)/FAD-dependent oxidoreductase [Maritalea porphyrae]